METLTGFTPIEVPAGCLRRGSTGPQLDRIASEQHLPRTWFEDEAPRAVVEVAPFRIGRTLVTNTQYAEFTDAIGFTTHAEERGFGLVYGDRFWEETEGVSWRYPAGPVGPCGRDLCAGDADAYATGSLLSSVRPQSGPPAGQGTHRMIEMLGSGEVSSPSAVRATRASCRARPHPTSVDNASRVHRPVSVAWFISLKTSSIIRSRGSTP